MIRKALVSLLVIFLLTVFTCVESRAQTSTCSTPCSMSIAQIQNISPKNVTITSACKDSAPVSFCQVQGFITTDATRHDVIILELSLPDVWNTKMTFIGNGLFGGQLPSPFDDAEYAEALQSGYAVAATNTGHDSCDHTNDATNGQCVPTATAWALHNIPSVKDFMFRAVHKTTVAAKKIISRYYNASLAYSYFDGCSTGGRQGLVEAEKYPADFDGIIAGDPAAGNLYAGFNWNEQAQLQTSSPTPSLSLDNNAVNLIDTSVRALCGETESGLQTTPLILDPPNCPFRSAPSTTANSLASLECPSGQTTNCLTTGQIATVNAILDGPIDTKGNQIYPGYSPTDPNGTMFKDAGWASITGCSPFDLTDPNGCTPLVAPYSPATPTYNAEPWGFETQPPVSLPNFTALGPLQWVVQDGYLRNFVYKDANYQPLTFSFSDQKAINKLTKNVARWGGDGMEANHLKKFVKKNHVLLLYHGWSDPVLSPYNTVNFFKSAQSILGSNISSNIRLFMVPGMHHCVGGTGPNTFDVLTALNLWVEGNPAASIPPTPPDGNSTTNPLVATHFQGNIPNSTVDRTMPLCSYPEVPVYNGGSANPNVASSWTCQTPAP